MCFKNKKLHLLVRIYSTSKIYALIFFHRTNTVDHEKLNF